MKTFLSHVGLARREQPSFTALLPAPAHEALLSSVFSHQQLPTSVSWDPGLPQLLRAPVHSVECRVATQPFAPQAVHLLITGTKQLDVGACQCGLEYGT